ncbi:hypothetical protein [Pseudomonas tohonis]|uniref:hypothetical protein n=1 Tax=Pseudomonas tohonis TaxID=2725477 RepID=UPI0021D9DE69|nr:hypothetical protein [Pseudomonas tohonis]UXY53424.1 hypothetical protein N9L84_02240 [Pseudomonas tohonis]
MRITSILPAALFAALFAAQAQAVDLGNPLGDKLNKGCEEKSAEAQAKLDEAKKEQNGLGASLLGSVADKAEKQLSEGCEKLDQANKG